MAFWEPCFGKDNECCDCECSWTKFLIWSAVVLLVGGLVAVLVVAFAVVFPPKATADDAVLQRFALAPGNPAANSTISYNLTLTLAVRNPNWAMGATFRSLEADYLFDGQRFDRVDVAAPGYVLPARKTAVFRIASGADAVSVMLGSAGVKAYRRQSGKGVFDVEAALSGQVKYQLHSTWCRLEARCPLKLQLAGGQDAAAVVFQKTTCELLRSSQRGC